jgi:outer membrane lipoprotein SlyB
MTMFTSGSRLARVLMLATTSAGFAVMTGAQAQDTISRSQKNQPIAITYGKVIAAEEVKMDSAVAGGAAVGGVVGLATGHGDRDRAKRAALGALLAGVLTKVAEGSRKAEAFTVQRSDGSTLKIVQDLADIRVGDCVSVEQGQTSNVRRVSDQMCVDGGHLQDRSIQRSHVQDADECHQAKDEVLKATTDDAFARAERKVRILCH